MTKRILVPIAPGTEEMEAVTIIDILVRANYDVVVASADFSGQLTMKASRGVTLTADCKLVDVADEEFAAVVLPGGIGGAEVFRDSTLLVEIVKQQKYDGRLVAAICATPAVMLEHHQLYPKAIMTCHPSLQERIPEQRWRNRRVTFDINHNLLTSQGPGTALEFAIEIIAQLSGKQRAKEVVLPLIPLPQLHYDKQEEA